MTYFLIFAVVVLSAIVVLLLLQRFTTLEFVSHAKLLFKTWSIWLTGIGSALGVWLADPDSPRRVIEIWNILPPELKTILPVNIATYFSYFLIVMGMIATFIRQPKLTEKRKELEDNHV